MSLPTKADVVTKTDAIISPAPIANKLTANDVNELLRASNDTIDLLDEMISILFDKPLAEIYFFDQTNLVTVSDSAVYYAMPFTANSSAENNKFTVSNTTLTYTGTIERVFIVRGLAVASDGSNETVRLAIFKNGEITAGRGEAVTGSGGRTSEIVTETILRLAPNDTVELRIRNVTSTNNITVKSLDLLIYSAGLDMLNGGA
jgi:hypothetical protein